MRELNATVEREVKGLAKAVTENLGSVAEKGRVGDWRGSGRRMGVAVPGGFRNAGASLLAVAPFPVAALRTGQAALPHPALQWDHAFRTRNTLATAGSRYRTCGSGTASARRRAVRSVGRQAC